MALKPLARGDAITFTIENAGGFAAAMRLAPKVVAGGIRREFKRAGSKFVTKAAAALLTGPPGISLPRDLVRTATSGKKKGRGVFLKGRAKAAKAVQRRHILAKTGGRSTIFLAMYTSTFLTFHESKIRAKLLAMFAAEAKAIQARVSKEAVRLVQNVLDKKLKDKGPISIGNPSRRLGDDFTSSGGIGLDL
ncbi:MAG: hypothetical protein OEQ18_00720 [Gammaproteobacteria bacterium]|nr:hypothetical protein [Gammaproteobacteria bacterium]